MEERDLVEKLQGALFFERNKKLYHDAIKHLADKDAFYTEFKERQRW
ncbi:hypothetical protein bcere0009_11190 [Bacillus cereus R309803]|nr:hypothetical protein bcere0009_11190 [Bacillus cereus R309803]